MSGTVNKATFAAGCFWSVELAYMRVPGTNLNVHAMCSTILLRWLSLMQLGQAVVAVLSPPKCS